MDSFRLKCSNCKANLDLNLDNMIAYCPFCGEKIIVDVQSLTKLLTESQVTERREVSERAKTERTKIIAEERKEQERIRAEKELEKERIKHKTLNSSDKASIISEIVYFVMIIICLVFLLLLGAYFDSGKDESDKNDAELQAVYEQVLEDIDNCNYTEARIKANTLYYTAGYSNKLEKKWNKIRKETLELIDEKEGLKKKNFISKTFDFVFGGD